MHKSAQRGRAAAVKQDNRCFTSSLANRLQIDWGAEMIGYVMAAAHLGIKHVLDGALQMRDVDGRRPAVVRSPC